MLEMSSLQRLLALVAAIACVQVTHGQGFTVSMCSAGPEACILLTDCPELLKLLRPPTRESIRRLQSLTCGFQGGRNPKVCCPPTPTVVGPTTPSPGEALLPELCGHSAPKDKVIGGMVAPLGGYPWMAVLGFTNVLRGTETEIVWECGGTLINDRYVLTAAHCTDRGIPLTKVRLGEHHLLTDPDCDAVLCASNVEEFTPTKIIRHPDYKKRGFNSDDIALVRLDRPAAISAYIQPVCLPPAGQEFVDLARGRTNVTVTGWGDTEDRSRSQQLLEVSLPIVSDRECRTALDYNTRLIAGGGQLCFGGGRGMDSCDKDSGGPAVMTIEPHGPPYLQVGVVSYGPVTCGSVGVPGVYTDVARYRSWIVDTIEP